jgi:hypothetical protein
MPADHALAAACGQYTPRFLSSQPKVIHEGAAILNDNFRSLIVDFLRLAA